MSKLKYLQYSREECQNYQYVLYIQIHYTFVLALCKAFPANINAIKAIYMLEHFTLHSVCGSNGIPSNSPQLCITIYTGGICFFLPRTFGFQKISTSVLHNVLTSDIQIMPFSYKEQSYTRAYKAAAVCEASTTMHSE